jgi:hypothetical protein
MQVNNTISGEVYSAPNTFKAEKQPDESFSEYLARAAEYAVSQGLQPTGNVPIDTSNFPVVNIMDIIRAYEEENKDNPQEDIIPVGLKDFIEAHKNRYNNNNNIVAVGLPDYYFRPPTYEEDFVIVERQFGWDKGNLEWALAGLSECRRNFDSPYSIDYRKLSRRDTDLSTLSDAEKYKAIYEHYQECFGDDFLKSFAFGVPYPGNYYSVFKAFNDEISEVFGGQKAAEKAYREAYYGDMTDDEIRKTIIENYPPKGKRTYRDIMEMSFDMYRAGVDNGLFTSGILQDVAQNTAANGTNYTRILDKIASSDYETKVMQQYQNRSKFTLSSSAGSVISDIFGA